MTHYLFVLRFISTDGGNLDRNRIVPIVENNVVTISCLIANNGVRQGHGLSLLFPFKPSQSNANEEVVAVRVTTVQSVVTSFLKLK